MFVAMDATHVESRNRQPEKKKVDAEELPTEIPKKKRSRKSNPKRNGGHRYFKNRVWDFVREQWEPEDSL
jgi:hypothetical protein